MGYALIKANEDIPNQHQYVAMQYMRVWTFVAFGAAGLAIVGCWLIICSGGRRMCRTYMGRHNGYDSFSRVENNCNRNINPADVM